MSFLQSVSGNSVPYGQNSFNNIYHDYGNNYASHAGYGHNDKDECCPLVIDSLTLVALLGLIAGGFVFLNVLITMNIMRRRKRWTENLESPISIWGILKDTIHTGRIN